MRGVGGGYGPVRYRNSRQSARSSVANKLACMKEGKCFGCGGKSHRSRVCPRMASKNENKKSNGKKREARLSEERALELAFTLLVFHLMRGVLNV